MCDEKKGVGFKLICICPFLQISGGLAAGTGSFQCKFVCVEVLRPSQPNGVMLSPSVYLTTRLLGKISPLSG